MPSLAMLSLVFEDMVYLLLGLQLVFCQVSWYFKIMVPHDPERCRVSAEGKLVALSLVRSTTSGGATMGGRSG